MVNNIVCYALFLHFIADFLLQSRDMGKKKSTDFKVLLQHLGILWYVVGFGLMPAIGIEKAILISGLNTLIHGIIDWNIWKGYKVTVALRDDSATPDTWKYWEDYWFYATIGLDQLLHAVTLVKLIGWFYA
jgi:hypothetical protein